MVTGRRVLVCGGRNFNDVQFVFHTLSRLNEAEPIERIIHGGASGADSIAGLWAVGARISVDVFPADWSKHGRAAVPIRNETMLRVGRPDLVVAFPGGHRTAAMVRRAELAGVTVLHAERSA